MGKVSWRSVKVISCSLCGGEERANLDKSISIICSICIIRLGNMPSDVLKRAYDRLIERGNFKKAELISSFIEGGSNARAKPIEETRKDLSACTRRVTNRAGFERVVRRTY